MSPSCRTTRDHDRGAAMIEATFVIPVMVLIFFGLTQLAFAMSTTSSATTASRTGARLASSSYAPAVASGTTAASLDNIRLGVERDLDGRPSQAEPVSLWVYEADGDGNPTSGASCSGSCIRWTWDGTQFASQTGTWTDPDACGTTIDWVGVRVVLEHDITAPALDDITVTRTTTMRLEPITDGSC